MFSLSQRSFHELKTKGDTRHRYVQLKLRRQPAEHFVVEDDQDGTLRRLDPGPSSPYRVDLSNTLNILVNGTLRSLPIINARGVLAAEHGDEDVRAKVLDDSAFSLVLEYEHVGWKFKIAYTSISYPGELEQQLAATRRAEAYGIYFDFNSDTLRPESEAAIAEIAAALTEHPDWALSINGHTDSVGDAGFNQDLSLKRCRAVGNALTQRLHIAPERLTYAGFGATQPKESNDTPTGRARNRRVELVRTR